MAILLPTYSFANFFVSISGPGGAFAIGGPDTGSAEEGFTVEQADDSNTLTLGSDGSAMNSMHSSRAGTVTVHLLKTSPINAKLSAMFSFQRQLSFNWALNVLSARDIALGDSYSCSGVAFKRHANNAWSKTGNILVWPFDVAILDPLLGPGFINT
jgi:hypothetical protein